MTTQAAYSVIQLGTEELRALVTPVNETIATGVNIQPSNPLQKKFGIADLRKIRRNSRMIGLIIR